MYDINDFVGQKEVNVFKIKLFYADYFINFDDFFRLFCRNAQMDASSTRLLRVTGSL